MENKQPKSKTPLIDRGPMPVIILTVIAAVCIVALALTSNLTQEARDKQEAEAVLSVQREFFPDAEEFTDIGLDQIITEYPGVTKIVEALDGSGNRLGFVITAEAMGYGGLIPATVGYDNDGQIVGARFEVSGETAGYGQNAAKPEFYSQFTAFNASQKLSADKGSTDTVIDGITGSTRSTNGIVDALNQAAGAFLLLN
ncbi:MAG: FMN-binding protein [Clostridiaceae bacterium]|nr:FMN-binding protein [Clostridiaceae bacterium]